MKVKPAQLKRHIASAIPRAVLIHGDEPLQVRESVDCVRQEAKAQGICLRERYVADADFDWQVLRGVSDNLSLFAEPKLVELRLARSVDARAGEVLQRCLDTSGDGGHYLLIHAERLDKRALKAPWASWVASNGLEVAVWPVSRHELPRFIDQRLQAAGFQAQPDALSLLAERTEGNMLAVSQEIAKLQLLVEPGVLDARALLSAVTDSARYSAYDLADSLLQGDRGRFIQISAILRAEGQEPVMILSVLLMELRRVLADPNSAQRLPQAVAQRLDRARKRLPASAWRRLLAALARLDAVYKGRADEGFDPWSDLEQRCLAFLAPRRR